MAHIGTMSTHNGRAPSDRRLKYLIESADECRSVSGGYRLRLARSNTMLLMLVAAIEANPAIRFTMTIDESGECWLDIRSQEASSLPAPAKYPAPKPPRAHVVA